MKKLAATFTLIAIALVLAGHIYFGDTEMYIQLYDTYFVFRFSTLIIPIFFLFVLLFSLTAAVKNKFKDRVYHLLFLLCVLTTWLFGYFFAAQLS